MEEKRYKHIFTILLIMAAVLIVLAGVYVSAIKRTDSTETEVQAELAVREEESTVAEILEENVEEEESTDTEISADIVVKKVENYDTNSIRGVDVSSFIALMNSFDAYNATLVDDSQMRGFRDWDGNLLDRQGFFQLLAQSGINYVRTRVWNYPYHSESMEENQMGYGGGNCDIDTAIEIGQYATKAGMTNLIDFHFSDFWADPSKQDAPKAWQDYTLEQKKEAIAEYTTECLEKLLAADVNVGMVQIGNETNGSFCGESGTGKDWANKINFLLDGGCDAVHAFNEKHGTEILVVVHFTNPEKEGNLEWYAQEMAKYDGDGDGQAEGVSYDIFASSYYPFWHGSMENLTAVLKKIASEYDKYVMVAETSWAYTLEDGDGHGNNVGMESDLGTFVDYSASVQWQAHSVRDVIDAVNKIDVTLQNGKRAALGVFYWEPAWIPVLCTLDEDGNTNEDIKAINQTYWETYGSGWASSYCVEYDPENVWYGGSSWDNQALFDHDGNPLESLNVFNYVSTGADAPLAVAGYTCDSIEIEADVAFSESLLPSTVTVIYNNLVTDQLSPVWDEEDIAAITNAVQDGAVIGTYTINGYMVSNDVSFDVKTSVVVKTKNLLKDGSFEDQNAGSDWIFTGSGYDIAMDTPSDGSYALHFYSDDMMEFQASQQMTVTEDGTYCVDAKIQGSSDTGANEGERIYIEVVSSTGKVYTSDDAILTGWNEFKQISVPEFTAVSGEELTVTVYVKVNAGAWGTIDEVYLY